jgi:hypothetical protein
MALIWKRFYCRCGFSLKLPEVWQRHIRAVRCWTCRGPLQAKPPRRRKTPSLA